MDTQRFPMSPSREPNPLRPYYIPPSIGPSPAAAAAAASSTPPSQASAIHATSRLNDTSSFSTSARDLFPDIDISSTTSEAWSHTRSLFDTLAWRYTSIVLAQPFDVAKTLLQVSLPQSQQSLGVAQKKRTTTGQSTTTSRGRGGNPYETETDGDTTEDSDDEENGIPDYFSATAPRSRSPRRRKRTPPSDSADLSPTPRPRNRTQPGLGSDDMSLRIKKPDSVMQAVSALYNTSGAVGLWRANNTTFLYSILLRTTDSFIRGLLLAILGLPDIVGPEQGGLAPGLTMSGGAGFSGIDLSDSPNPLGSLLVIGLASCLTGLLLAPLDLVRTRLIVTPISEGKRGLVSNLKRLPSFFAPASLWTPTALYHLIPNVFSAATPLFLRRQLRIAPELTPSLWSLASFSTTLTELFIRLPLETLVRRAQVQHLKQADPEMKMIVEPASYSGVWGTVYGIMYTEGETTTKAKNGMLRTRRGQGVAGLVRGWRVGFWGLVGVWGAGALGPGDKGREF